MVKPGKILLLAGTAEARQLAHLLKDRGYNAEVSLAGRTRDPKPYPILTRSGGFGGIDGLESYIKDNNIACLINATHPFAAQMTEHAHTAATNANIPCLHFRHPEWRAQKRDFWTSVPTIEAAAASLPQDAVAFLATGSSSAKTFAGRPDIRTILRVIEMPAFPEGPNETRVIARPPFTLEHEIETLRAKSVTHLVCKNSGGKEGRTKLAAACELGLPVIMVERPAMPRAAIIAASIDIVMDCLEKGLSIMDCCKSQSVWAARDYAPALNGIFTNASSS